VSRARAGQGQRVAPPDRVVVQFVAFRSAKAGPFAERKATFRETVPLPGPPSRAGRGRARPGGYKTAPPRGGENPPPPPPSLARRPPWPSGAAMPTRVAPALAALALALSVGPAQAKPVALFDGKTFAGWDGDTKETWSIKDGCIVGGSLTRKIPRNQFLATRA